MAVDVGVAVLVMVLVGVWLYSGVMTTKITRAVGVLGISVLVGTSVGVGVAVSGIRVIWVPRVGEGVFERVAALQRDNRGRSQTSRAINANPKTPASAIHQYRLAGFRPFWIRRCSAGKRSPAWPRKTGQV